MLSKPNTGLLPLKIRLEYHQLTISNTLAYCVMVLNLAVKNIYCGDPALNFWFVYSSQQGSSFNN